MSAENTTDEAAYERDCNAYEEALDLAVYLRRAMEEMETKNTCSRCVWKEDEDGSWWSDCDNGFIFNDSGPHENEFEFCPYCGKKITVNLFCDNTEAQATRPAPNNDEN